MEFAIPIEDVYITRCEQVGSGLKLRFVQDFHPEHSPDDQVLQLALEEVESVAECLTFFHDLMDVKPIYLQLDGNRLTAMAGAGKTLSVLARAISSSYCNMDSEELRKQVQLLHSWYCSTHDSLRDATRRIKAAHELIAELTRRTELKVPGHEPKGTASVLYEQQLHLLKRISQTLEE